MRFVFDASDLAATGKGFVTAADLLPARLTAGLRALQPKVEYVGVAEVKAVTPGLPSDADSLMGGTIPRSEVTDRSIETRIFQPKMVRGLEKGKDYSLAWILIRGRREITFGPFGKKAMFWEGDRWAPGADHPITSATQKERPPNPYPEKAVPAIRSALSIMAERLGEDVLHDMLKGRS